MILSILHLSLLSHNYVTCDCNLCNVISYLLSKSKIKKKKRNTKIKLSENKKIKQSLSFTILINQILAIM